jgi:hypothetical protein
VRHAWQPQTGWLTVQAWTKRYLPAVTILAQSLPVLWFCRHGIAPLPVLWELSATTQPAKMLAQTRLQLH